MTARAAARLAAVLFVVAAGLFAVGVSAEDDVHDEAAEVAESHDEGDEGVEEGEADRSEAEEADSEEETVLGIDVESPAAVAAAAVLSVALAAGLWFSPLRQVAIVAAVFGVLFAAFDIAEVVHQLDESNKRLAALAAVITAVHLAASVAAGWSLRENRSAL